MRERLYDFDARVVRETDCAYLLRVMDVGRDVWFPKSVAEDNRDGTFTVPEHWAIEKEIV